MLCGGLGTRLRPVLPDLPKPLAPVAGRPFLELLLAHLSRKGLARFVLCSGHGAASIEAARDSLSRWGEVVLSPEPEPLGTGGALRFALKQLHSAPFFVFNGDSFADVDLEQMLVFHRESAARVTLAVVESHEGPEGGALTLSRNGEVLSFQEKGQLGSDVYLSAGVYLMSPEVLLAWEDRTCFSLELDVFPRQIGKRIFGFEHRGALVDIGTPERYEEAGAQLISAGLIPSRDGADQAG